MGENPKIMLNVSGSDKPNNAYRMQNYVIPISQVVNRVIETITNQFSSKWNSEVWFYFCSEKKNSDLENYKK